MALSGVIRKTIWAAVFLILAGGGVVSYVTLQASKSIFDLLGENKKLKEAVALLTEEQIVGYAKVLKQEERNGQVHTRLLFVVTDPEDPSKRIVEEEFDLLGNVVFFDALIVKFHQDAVIDGRERALFLWRRVYGEATAPQDGIPLDRQGQEPKRYQHIFSKLSLKNRELFWSEIWKLSDDPDRLAAAGVKAIYGNAVYKNVRPGLIYRFSIDASGAFYPESVPDL